MQNVKQVKNNKMDVEFPAFWKGMSKEEKAMFEEIKEQLKRMQMNIDALNANNTYLRESNDQITRRLFEIERRGMPQPSAPPAHPPRW